MDSFLLSLFTNPTDTQKLLLTVIFTWSLCWKAIALWRSAKSDDKLWFVGILIVNTFGLLEIAYIFYLSKNKLRVEDVRMFFNNLNVKKLRMLLKNNQKPKAKKS